MNEPEDFNDEAISDCDEQKQQIISLFDPRVRDVVQTSFKSVMKSLFFLSILFIFILLLFYGMSWNPKDNYHNIQLAIVDLDGGMIGQALLAAGRDSVIPFTVTILANDSTIDFVKERVNVGDFNAALVANAGASQTLMAALIDPSAEYTPALATSFIFDEGRGGSAMASLLRATVPTIDSSGVNVAVAQALFKTLSDRTSPTPLSTLNPTPLLSPVGCTEVNLHPVLFNGENSAAGLGESPRRPQRPNSYVHHRIRATI